MFFFSQSPGGIFSSFSLKSKKSKDKLKADTSLDTTAEPESPKGLDKFKLKTKKDIKKPKKESKTSLKSVESTTSNLSSNATFADRSMGETTVNVSAISTSPSFTRTYDYTEEEHGATKKRKPVGGFTYENDMQKSKESILEIPTSPSKRAQGLAFNYAPGEAKKVAETAAEKRKTFMEKATAEGIKTPGIKTSGINYVQSAVHKEESVKKEPKTIVETKVEPTIEVKFTKTVLDKKVTSASTETSIETEKKRDELKSGSVLNQKSKDESSKSVLGKAMNKLSSFGKGSKDTSEVDVKKESSDFIENEKKLYEHEKPLVVGTAPLIVKTTTKQTMIKDNEGVTQNIEEKVEDLISGEVTVSTQHNKVRVVNILLSLTGFLFLHGFFVFLLCAQAEGMDSNTTTTTPGRPPYVKATAVTTRTATTHQDLEKNSKTSQVM